MAFRLIAVALVVVMVELLSWGAFALLEPEPFSYARLRSEIAARREGGEVAGGNPIQNMVVGAVLHPYLGFVYGPPDNEEGFVRYHGHPVNRQGLIDSGPTVRKRQPGRFLVGITGGSVAYWLSAQGDEALKAALRSVPEIADREIVVVRLALGGYKQPQQVMALNWLLSLGGELDVLINLDGFNEATLSDLTLYRHGIDPFYPRTWPDHIAGGSSVQQLELIGEVVSERKRQEQWAVAIGDSIWERSVTGLLIWKVRDRLLGASLGRARAALEAYEPPEKPWVLTGPGTAGIEAEDLQPMIAAHWVRCSVLLDGICRANGIRYFHFRQPNQYVRAKPMSAAERAFAIQDDFPLIPSILAGYQAMDACLDDLETAGVAFLDLVPIFDHVQEAVWGDNCCHLNAYGNGLMGARMGAFVAEGLSGQTPSAPGVLAYGRGDAGAGGIAPRLLALTGPFAGSELSLEIRGAVGGAEGYVAFGDAVTGGTFFPSGASDLEGLHLVAFRTDGEIGQPGTGRAAVTMPVDPSKIPVGTTVHCQAFIKDPEAARGWTRSNALRLTVQKPR